MSVLLATSNNSPLHIFRLNGILNEQYLHGGSYALRSKLILIVFLCAVLSIFSLMLIIYDPANEMKSDIGAKSEISMVSSTQPSEYLIFIEVEDKTLYLLSNGECIKQYPIATGKWGLPSPLGCWKIVQKGDWGEGFGGRWMGFDVPWGKYGIHGTLEEGSIGWASSEGCIRMFNEDVKELYSLIPYGTKVVIVNGSFGPFGSGFAEINPGDIGADVMAIQQRLKMLGFYKGGVDGIYGDGMKSAIHNFQKKNGLTVTNRITKKAWNAMGFREFE